MEGPAFFDGRGGIGYWDQVDYYDLRNPWHFSYHSQSEEDEAFDE
jgi:hypothetical protein